MLAVAAVVAAVLAFLSLASEVTEGETGAFDRAILLGIRAATEGDGGWQQSLRGFMLDMTALGDPAMLAFVVLLAAGFLVAARRSRLAALLVVSTALGAMTGTLLKLVFGRARPDVVTHLVEIHSMSFPSGHAMHSAVVYLTLAAMIVRAEHGARVRGYVLGAGVLLTLLVGMSRLYLGVHWPTDVLAGWLLGAGWAFGASLVARRLQREHKVEQPA